MYVHDLNLLVFLEVKDKDWFTDSVHGSGKFKIGGAAKTTVVRIEKGGSHSGNVTLKLEWLQSLGCLINGE